MSIFGKVAQAEPTLEQYEGFVDENLSGLQSILTESAMESSRLQAGMYIADIQMEESVLEGANPEVLMESFVKTSFEKLKKLFNTLWSKVRAWFEKAKDGIKLLFLSGEKFIKEFKDDLTKKKTVGFKHTGYEYTLSAGDTFIKTKERDINDSINEIVSFRVNASQMTLAGQKKDLERASGKSEAPESVAEVKEKMLSALKVADQQELLSEAQKSFRNGKDTTEEFESFSGNSKETYIQIVESTKNNLRIIEKANADINTQFKRVLSAIDRVKSDIAIAAKDDSSAEGRMVAFANQKFEVARFGIGLLNSLYGIQVGEIKSASKQAVTALKGYLRFKGEKPVKEGYEGQEDNSLLESAMNHFA